MFRNLRQILVGIVFLFALTAFSSAWAQQMNIDVDSPGIAAIKGRMQTRHTTLAPLYENGSIGLMKDGSITIRILNNVPINQRQTIVAMVNDENNDRDALYREVARVNKHPEWERQIRETFALRWQQKMQSMGWWFQDEMGTWKKR